MTRLPRKRPHSRKPTRKQEERKTNDNMVRHVSGCNQHFVSSKAMGFETAMDHSSFLPTQ